MDDAERDFDAAYPPAERARDLLLAALCELDQIEIPRGFPAVILRAARTGILGAAESLADLAAWEEL